MTSGAYFVCPEGANLPTVVDGYTTVEWPTDGPCTDTVVADLSWTLMPLPHTTAPVADLLHVAGGAYIADRSTPRGIRFSRSLALKVAVLAPHLWTEPLVQTVAGLLGWLTGDDWDLTVVPADDRDFPEATAIDGIPQPVSLLSGGLDSFLGAIHLLQRGQQPQLVGHKDTAPSIRHAQSNAGAWLARAFDPAPSYSRFALSQAVPAASPPAEADP